LYQKEGAKKKDEAEAKPLMAMAAKALIEKKKELAASSPVKPASSKVSDKKEEPVSKPEK
jgi:hypothetical protein